MILPSSQKSSVIKPSQPKMAAVGDPHGGEIPMRSICVDRLMCSRLGDIEDKCQPKGKGLNFYFNLKKVALKINSYSPMS
ncbi:MAG: hypothetical protein SPC22_03255 [Ruminococcus bromii]|nr:hypothetical protein [Ruminococcus bromii]